MPNTYTFDVLPTAKEFSYNGKLYEPGDTSPQLEACKLKDFISAYRAANPDGGIDATKEIMAGLEKECPATPNSVAPQPAPTTPPSEENPATTGGDSAQQQGAPKPPISGIVTGNPDDKRYIRHSRNDGGA